MSFASKSQSSTAPGPRRSRDTGVQTVEVSVQPDAKRKVPHALKRIVNTKEFDAAPYNKWWCKRCARRASADLSLPRTSYILRDLCEEGLNWDDPIPPAYHVRWRAWLKELPKLQQFSVDRCFQPKDFGDVVSWQLHIFRRFSAWLRSCNISSCCEQQRRCSLFISHWKIQADA